MKGNPADVEESKTYDEIHAIQHSSGGDQISRIAPMLSVRGMDSPSDPNHYEENNKIHPPHLPIPCSDNTR